MDPNLQIVDRFIGIIAAGESNSQRLKTEWQYLYKLLRGQPIAFDRIDAYLNILQQQDSTKKKAVGKAKSSQAPHPQARKYKTAVQSLSHLLAQNDEKIQLFKKGEPGLKA